MISCTPPTRRNFRSSSTRNNLACISVLVEDISSRNRIPPSATSIRPGLRFVAPVKAPASCPKSSDSIIVSGSAAQLMGTKGLSARGPAMRMTLAIISLPVPVSPVMSTETEAAAARSASSAMRAISGVSPTIHSYWSWEDFLNSASSRRNETTSLARSTALINCSKSKGFWRKSWAPCFMASTAMSTSPNAVMRITGGLGFSRSICSSRDSPDPSGSTTSKRTISAAPVSMACRAAAKSPASIASYPASLNAPFTKLRAVSSSSTMRTVELIWI